MHNSTLKKWKRNQKLTDQQIQEIKHLKANGVRIHLIAQIIEAEHGLSRSAVYYHLSENREPYCNTAKKIRHYQREKIKQRIRQLIDQGYTTGWIAHEWNIPLKYINKLYTT